MMNAIVQDAYGTEPAGRWFAAELRMVAHSERRERERLDLRTRILDAARELFIAEGFEAVSMRKIGCQAALDAASYA